MPEFKYNIGDKVRFVLAEDIEAIVIGRSLSYQEIYEVAWIDSGQRFVEQVHICEIVKA